MKTSFVRIVAAATFGLTALAPMWGSLTKHVYAVRLPPNRVIASSNVTLPKQIKPEPIPPAPATTTSPDSSAQWVNLKDYTFAQRDSLLAGLAGMEARVDAQIEELKAKRASMTESTRTADWDFAMKEMQNARSTLKFNCEELSKATSETWSQQRDRVGLAWERTQNAYAAVKSSTTM
jgi:hypothetical protein